MESMLTFSFFSISPGGGEFILILLVVLLLFGAKNVPKIARNVGKALEEFRRAAREVSDEIMRSDIETYKPDQPQLTSDNRSMSRTVDYEEEPLETEPVPEEDMDFMEESCAGEVAPPPEEETALKDESDSGEEIRPPQKTVLQGEDEAPEDRDAST